MSNKGMGKRKASGTSSDPIDTEQEMPKHQKLTDDQKKKRDSQLLAYGKHLFDDNGFKLQLVEGLGDCWAIAIMAGDDREVPLSKIASLKPVERQLHINKKRSEIFNILTTPDDEGGSSFTFKEVVNMAKYMPNAVPHHEASLHSLG